MYCKTLERLGSFLVHVRMSAAVTSESSKCSTSSTISGGVSDSAGSSNSGKRLRASAFACDSVFLNTNLYSYEDRKSDHRFILLVVK